MEVRSYRYEEIVAARAERSRKARQARRHWWFVTLGGSMLLGVAATTITLLIAGIG